MLRSKLFGLLVTAMVCLTIPAKSMGVREVVTGRQWPIEIYDGYLIVLEGSAGDQQGLKFLVDTGSTFTTIDRKLADSLNLARYPGEVINLDRTLTLTRAVLPSISYGPQTAHDVPVLVADLRYFRSNGVKIDAVIGLDILARENFCLDFAHKRIIFGALERLANAVAMEADAVSVNVQMDLDGYKVWMIADTGMPGILLYEDRLVTMNANYRVQRETTGRSMSGAIHSKIALLPRLRLGDQDLDRLVYLTDDPRSADARNTAGYLGLAALHAKEIEFDFEHGELRWTK
jgi:hypothetical protein